MFSYKQKAFGEATARLRGARATADASVEVMSLCSAVPALEAKYTWDIQREQRGCRRVNLSVTVLKCGKGFVPTRLILKSTENIWDQMRPVDFVGVVKLNVNMHVDILWRP